MMFSNCFLSSLLCSPPPRPMRSNSSILATSTSVPSIHHVPDDPVVARDAGPVGPFVEAAAHEPAVGAGRRLIDAADAAPPGPPGTRSLHGRKPLRAQLTSAPPPVARQYVP